MRVSERPRSVGSVARSTASLPWLKTLIRLLIGLGVTAILLARSDISALARTLTEANPAWIAAAAAMNIAVVVVSAFRWRAFLVALGIGLTVATTVRLTFIGTFFNAFLPTGVGGDAYKAIRIRTSATSLATSFASVLLDRIVGIVTLALVGLPISLGVVLVGRWTALTVTALVLSVGVLVGTPVVLLGGRRLLQRGRGHWFGIRPRLLRTVERVNVPIKDVGTLRRSLALGFVCQGLGIAAQASLASALGLGIPLQVIALAFLTTTLASALPITINGLGIREGVLVWGLGLHGVASSSALAYGLLILGVALATSAIGGIVYAVAGGDSPRTGSTPSQ